MKIEGDVVFGTVANTLGSGGYVSGVQVSGRMNFTQQQQWMVRNCEIGAVGVFRQKFTLDDAVGSQAACSLEASRCATNGIPLGYTLLLPFTL